MKTIAALLLTLLLSAASFATQPTTWKVDKSHSSVQFSVSHLVISDVTGQFKEFNATLTGTKEDFSDAQVVATIKIASIDTEDEGRDKHLLAADFFDAEKHPEMTFTSTKFEKAGVNKYKIGGTLTLHGVSKPVVLDAKYNGQVKDPWGNTRAGFKATATINRADFGVNWNKALETGGLVVGENVEVTLNLELIKQSAEANKEK